MKHEKDILTIKNNVKKYFYLITTLVNTDNIDKLGKFAS